MGKWVLLVGGVGLGFAYFLGIQRQRDACVKNSFTNFTAATCAADSTVNDPIAAIRAGITGETTY